MPAETEITQLESNLLRTAPDAMLVVDQSGRIVLANALAERLFGYPQGTLPGQALHVLIPEQLREPHQRHLTEYLRAPRPRPMGTGLMLSGVRRDGGEFAVEISLNPLPTPTGLHILAAIRDVNDYWLAQRMLKQASAELERQVAASNAELLQINAELHQQIAERAQTEVSLREAEALYRQLVESQPDLICRYLPDTTLTFVNAAYARFFNRRPAELLGQRFIDFLGAEEQAELWKHLATFTPAAPARQYEHKTIGAAGIPRWHLWHGFAFFDDRGHVTGFQSVGVDITERKQMEAALRASEGRFHQMAQAAFEGIAVSVKGRLVDVNEQLAEMLGYAPAELIDGDLLDLIAPEARERVRQRIQSGTLEPAELDLRRKDGSTFPVEVQVRSVLYRGERVRITAIRDITERKQAETLLRQSEERLRLALRAAGAGAWEWNAATNQAIWSDENYRVLGLTPGSVEACYDNWLRCLHPEDRAEAERQVVDAMEQGGELNIEFRVARPDGDIHWVNDVGQMLYDPAGKPIGMYGVQIDITERKQAEQALRVSEEHYRLLVENQTDLVVKVDTENRFLFVSPSYCATFGKSRDELLGSTFMPLVHEQDREATTKVMESLFRPPHQGYIEQRALTKEGWRWLAWADKAVLDSERKVIAIIGVGRDITERKQAEEALFEAKERAQVTLHSIGDAVITTDAQAVVDYLNPVAEALTGWITAEARGQPLSKIFRIVNEYTREPAPDPVARCLREGRIVGLANHSVLIGRGGLEYHINDTAAPIRGRDGQVLGAVLVFHDISETRQLTRQLEYDATHDALTGLINRVEFERRLERALASARRYGAQHALCYLDLDQFKVVNDTAGHAAGDELLKQINTLLSGMFRERDTLARIGGDEFGLLLDNCPLAQAQLIAQAVVSNIQEHRFHWEGRTYQIGVSIGVVAITAEAQDTTQLLTQADVACYTAKELGRNQVHVYQPADSESALRHSEILGAAGLRDALEQDRFRLHYQPIVPLNAPDPRPTRYEALLRVVYKGSPEENTELVLPAAFIPAAERYGLMSAIDRWVIQAAFRDYAGGIGQTGARIAINLSGNSLSDETLLAFIEAQFVHHAFPPEQVCFEITETAAIHNLRRATELMTALKRRGCEFALDDFGSGLSSFHYLKTLPVDYLKIDGSFVKDMIENAHDCALVAAINQMSHTLGIQTIAEYTHSPAIVECLRGLGVDYAQGYFFGQPAPWDKPS